MVNLESFIDDREKRYPALKPVLTEMQRERSWTATHDFNNYCNFRLL